MSPTLPPRPAAPPVASSAPVDLLGDFHMPMAPAQPASSSMFAALNLGSGAGAAAQPAPAQSAAGGAGMGGGLSAFDELLGLSSGPAASDAAPRFQAPFSLSHAVLQMAGMSPDTSPQVLQTTHGGLEIAVATAAHGPSVMLLVQTRNTGSGSGDVTVTVLPPPGVDATFPPGQSGVGADGRARTPSMHPQGGAALVVSLAATHLAPGGDAMRIQVESGAGAEVPCHVPLPLLGFQSFLRPAGLSEADFGASWGAHAEEVRVEVAAVVVKNAEDFERLVPARLNLKVVKVIGTEVISAGMHPVGGICLVHARIGQSLNFIVRTKNAVFTQNVATCISSLLSV
mmetsp:Transcript_27510/g.65536  ORF Transcript_27510/g.65536 Transcript_27510/m.65536 type:complete len:342 (+) Transcript_27510:201-1226(+)